MKSEQPVSTTLTESLVTVPITKFDISRTMVAKDKHREQIEDLSCLQVVLVHGVVNT